MNDLNKSGRCISNTFVMAFLFILLVVTTVFSFSVGRYPITVSDLLRYIFTGNFVDANLPTILLDIRMPRIIAAILAGGALSVSGAAYQGLFRNPMVSPDILGVSSGAGFGAALAILLSFGIIGIQLSAFCMGLVSVFLALFISNIIGRSHDKILMLILAGMIVGSMFSALISLMKYVADSEFKLPDITFWLMGSLSNVTLAELKWVAPIIFVTLIPLLLLSWKLNVLSFGDEEAQTLGVNTKSLRIIIILSASLLTASIVCITGLIG